MSSPSAKTMLMLCSLVAGRGCVTSEQVSEMMGISMPTASQRLCRASSLGLLVKNKTKWPYTYTAAKGWLVKASLDNRPKKHASPKPKEKNTAFDALVKKTPIHDVAVIRAMKSRKNSLLVVWR